MADTQEWLTATEEKPYAERNVAQQIALAARYQTLILEEANEINEELGCFANGHGSLARLIKEISDMLYHCHCLANLMETPVPPVFQLVHANNMTKINPETGEYIRREDGKVEKPEGFKKLTEADIYAVLGMTIG
jgi:predicted HAD superfamily Cof-like phosphohydrolase